MTPGISPLSASERKHKRQMPNLRRNARGRPHRLQRLCWRLENFGFLLSLTRFAVVAILLPIVSSSRLPFFKTSSNLFDPSHAAISRLSRPEWQPQAAQQRAGMVVALRRSHHGDVHYLELFRLGVVDLGKNQLIVQSDGLVPSAIE